MKTVLALALCGVAACGGDVLTDHPDGGTYVQRTVETIAVEPDEDQVWFVHSDDEYVSDGTMRLGGRAHLAALKPGGKPSDILEVDAVSANLVFLGAHRALALSFTPSSKQAVALLDTDARTKIMARTLPNQLNGVRASPSGKFVLAQGNGLLLMDGATLEANDRELLSGFGTVGEWHHTSDHFVLASTNAKLDKVETQVRRWNVTSVAGWDSPELDITLPGCMFQHTQFAVGFADRRMAISADDRWVVIPLQGCDGATTALGHGLVLLDQTNGSTHILDEPMQFVITPDSKTLVTFAIEAPNNLVFHSIDLSTRIATTSSTPTQLTEIARAIVSADGHYLTVCDSLERVIAINDLVAGTVTMATRNSGSVYGLARTGQDALLLQTPMGIDQLSLSNAMWQTLQLGGAVDKWDLLPMRDWLVVAEAAGTKIGFYDLTTQKTSGVVAIPSSLTSKQTEPVAP